MSYKKLNQININCDSFLSNVKFSNPISNPNSGNNRNISSPNNRNISSANNRNISNPNSSNNRNISSPNNRNNRNISYNLKKSSNNYLVNNIENESPNICFSNNKAALCKDNIKDNKSCCC